MEELKKLEDQKHQIEIKQCELVIDMLNEEMKKYPHIESDTFFKATMIDYDGNEIDEPDSIYNIRHDAEDYICTIYLVCHGGKWYNPSYGFEIPQK